MTVEIKERLNNIKKKLSEVRAISQTGVLVGFPSKGLKRDTGKLSNAEIAYYQEFGTTKIPARPFLTPAVQNNLKQVSALLKIDPDNPSNTANLERAGLYVSSKAKENITKQNGFSQFAPLSPVTLRARRNKRKNKKAGTKALIDTGQLRQSITYVIEEGAKSGAD